jgi:WD40 repeat protein
LGLVIAVVVVGLTILENAPERDGLKRQVQGWREQHFGPRGRGVARRQETGEYFTGRTRAMRELAAWLAAEGGGLWVVTGDPGSGKSAVLGRLVALADRAGKRASPRAAPATVPPRGSIDVAVWANGLTMTEVVHAIAVGIGVRAAASEQLVDAMLERGRPLVVAVDALDEAGGEGEGRRIAQRLLKPLAAAGRDAGIKVLVGTRRGPDGELVAALGPDAHVIDLDTPEYFERDDLTLYILRRLLREGEAGARTAYAAHPALARRIALAVSERASPSFLIGYLVSGALRERGAVDTSEHGWEARFSGDVGSAMEDYLDCFEDEADHRRARDLLSALAYAEGGGLPHEQELWPRVAAALAKKVDDVYSGGDVDWLLQSTAADLVDETVVEGTVSYRLFHESLASYLRTAREDSVASSERRIADALLARVPVDGAAREWSRADRYTRIHLATHAAAGGCLDGLLDDPDYLLTADSARLLAALPATNPSTGVGVKRAYQRALEFVSAAPAAERPSFLEMAARQTGALRLAEAIAERHPQRPWCVGWAAWRAGTGHVVLGHHEAAVRAVAWGEIDGRSVAVTAGDDWMLRVWDLVDRYQIGEPLTNPGGWIVGLVVGRLDGHLVAVSCERDGAFRVWDLADGREVGESFSIAGTHVSGMAGAFGSLDGHAAIVVAGDDGTLRVCDLVARRQVGDPIAGGLTAVAVGELGGRSMAVSAGQDGTVRVWDLVEHSQVGEALTGHDGPLTAIALGMVDDRVVAVSAGVDRTIRVWDLADHRHVGEPLATGQARVDALATGQVDGRAIAVSAGDRSLRVWDLTRGCQFGMPLLGHGGFVRDVAVCDLHGRPVAVSASDDSTVRLWDLNLIDTGSDEEPETSTPSAVAICQLDDRAVTVAAGHDGALRVWDLDRGDQWGEALGGHDGEIWDLAVGSLDRRVVALSGGEDGTLRLWDLADRRQLGGPLAHDLGPVEAVAMGMIDRRPIALAADGASLRIWDVADRRELPVRLSHDDKVRAVVLCEFEGRAVAVSGGHDRLVHVWDVVDGRELGEPLAGHTDAVLAIAAGKVGDRAIAVSAGFDGMLCIWDLASHRRLGDALTGHGHWWGTGVWAVALGVIDGRTVAVSGGNDRTLRLWDVAQRTNRALPVGSTILALAMQREHLVVGAAEGVMDLRLSEAALPGA